MRKIKLQKGFTIVELLLYMGIFSILIVVMLQIFTMILSTHAESQATSNVDQDGSFILSRLTYDIHKASGITLPVVGTNCTATKLNTSCILTVGGKTYQMDGNGNLNLVVAGDLQHLNSVNTEIESITFATLGNSAVINFKPSVEIEFTLKSKILQAGGRADTKTFHTTIGTR